MARRKAASIIAPTSAITPRAPCSGGSPTRRRRGYWSAAPPISPRRSMAALTSEVASRFGVVVWERMAATAIPLAGAAGGAAINMIFMKHFQSVAKGHFTLRRLERIHGEAAIRHHFSRLDAAKK